MIEANTTIPTSHSHKFTTVRDNQTQVKIIVFQGDDDVAANNELLGEFIMGGLRSAPAGAVEVDVTFNISADGIVSVMAKDLETGKEHSITVTATSGLTEEELHNMIAENADYLVALKEDEELERERTKMSRLLREVEKLVTKLEGAESVEVQDACDGATLAIHNGRGAMESREQSEVSAALAALDSAKSMLESLID